MPAIQIKLGGLEQLPDAIARLGDWIINDLPASLSVHKAARLIDTLRALRFEPDGLRVKLPLFLENPSRETFHILDKQIREYAQSN